MASLLTDKEFKELSDLLRTGFGINWSDDKRFLAEIRIKRVMKANGFLTSDVLMAAIRSPKNTALLSGFVDHATTNHTHFWRESSHFELFQERVLPELTAKLKKTRDLRVWCAAASSGEEPYTLAAQIALHLKRQGAGWKGGVLATDLSSSILKEAREGRYPDERVRPLPSELKKIMFKDGGDGSWLVRPEIKREMTFRRFNLVTKQYPFRRRFHVIFCRNVMIYFDQPTMQHVVDNMTRFLEPGGYLFIGCAESFSRLNHRYKQVIPGAYQLPE